MKNMLKVFASMACALALVACGGGSKDTTTTPTTTEPAFTKTDTSVPQVGSNSLTATNGDLVSVQYTLWLYDANAADKKGQKIESSYNPDGTPGTPYTFTLGAGKVIVGWDQGIVGMKVDGQRNLIIPSTMAYGATGKGSIPANAALVYDVKVVAISR
jgi:FKBP-type peptidyl-prolyl cis-trans isomerase FkpA